MTAYFDANNSAHTALLPQSVRGYSDLAAIAASVEADVINAYTVADPSATTLNNRSATQLGTSTRYVFLSEYTENADDADAAFALALRRAIVDVIRWRIATIASDLDVTAKSDASGASRSYRPDVLEPFPSGWDRWLAPYDTREPVWSF